MLQAWGDQPIVQPAGTRPQAKMAPPDVSVIIPAHNAAPFVHRAIRSVLAQTRQPKEVIVVDDGSVDDTARTARELHAGIMVIRQENRGPGAARNTGVRASTSELVCFLDADDEYRPEMIESLSRALADFPSAHIASGAFFEESEGLVARYPSPNNVPVDGSCGLVPDFFTAARRSKIAHTSSVMVRKRAFESVDGFREDVWFGEDVDLWCKLAGSYDWVFLDLPVSVYHHSASTSSTLRTPESRWPTRMLMDEGEMRRRVRAALWRSYRLYRRDFLTARARSALLKSAPQQARELLKHVGPAPMSLGWAATWVLAHAPLSVGKSLLELNGVVRDARKGLHRVALGRGGAPMSSCVSPGWRGRAQRR